MKVDSYSLRRLRTEKRWSRDKLAEKSSVSARQIQRLETPSETSKAVRGSTLRRLATALRVPPEALIESSTSPEATRPEQSTHAQELAPRYRLAYDLVEQRYGVGYEALINMAPLFFVLLAEGSLAWRREKMGEADEIAWKLDKISQEIPHVGVNFGEIYTHNLLSDEDNSISQNDLFGNCPREWNDGYSLDAHEANPFAKYLSDLVDTLDASGVVSIDRVEWESFPDYNVCHDDLNEIANNCPHARKSLESGCARIADIPEEFKEDAEARQQWLSNKLPDDIRELSPEGLEEKRDFTALMNRATRADLEVLRNVLQAKKEEMHPKADGSKEGEVQ